MVQVVRSGHLSQRDLLMDRIGVRESEGSKMTLMC